MEDPPDTGARGKRLSPSSKANTLTRKQVRPRRSCDITDVLVPRAQILGAHLHQGGPVRIDPDIRARRHSGVG